MTPARRVFVVAGLTLAASAAGFAVYRIAFARPAPVFRFATVERGDIQARVSATGALQAVTTVSVGTQVSGQVSELLVDFNDHVKKGQLLARIDPTLARQGVEEAQADLERIQAQATQARSDQARNLELASSGLIPASTLEQGGSALQVADATVRTANVVLERARQNLSFTSIYAPIDGVVVERNVNNGQTVAASLAAPQLFLIANDLSRMQILALVGESDIERIAQGQSADFTVQALPGKTFSGTVQQVRLQSTTADNVVNYTVIVAVENPGGVLLPGMTARIDFLVKSAGNVLKAPNAALRYKPSDDVLARFGTPTPSTNDVSSAGSPPTARPPAGAGTSRARRGQEGATTSAANTLYTLDAKGALQVQRVRLGISDGQFTEVEGDALREGMRVIDGVASTTVQPAVAAGNPMAGSQQAARGRPGGAF